MTDHFGPIYEVTLFVNPDVASDCDQWLEAHVRETLRIATVVDCNVFALGNDDTGRSVRKVQYTFSTDEALDDYLDDAAAQFDSQIAQHFSDQVEFHKRVLREDKLHYVPQGDTPDCLNCGTHLRGQYCGHCGQRSRGRLISLWELITDAFGDLFEIDSRLWQTIVPMMIRPGRLTHDYLQGRRARFMPPFRMYLVMSLIFFVIAFFDPREELGLFFEPVAEVEAPADEQGESENEDEDGDSSVIVAFNDNDGEEIEDDCNIEADGMDELPDFLARRLTIERMTHVCEQIVADEGKTLTAKVLDSTPTALIVLLPLMALVLKALYPLSRRFYVEHLLFFVHFHAFVFLLLTIQILLTRLAALVGIPEIASTVTVVTMSVYIPVYVFIAMRRVYGQGRIVTFIKFVILTFSYITGFSIILAATFLLAAFSI